MHEGMACRFLGLAPPRVVLILTYVGLILPRAVGGEPEADRDAFVARLVRPDRQATEVLRLFEGARWSDPAAALAAWKQRTGHATPIGKPAEALIALFNPEMAAEARVLDGAEIRLQFDSATGSPAWFAIVPRDDGTLASGVTAMRLTYPDDRPLTVDGRERPVARLGRSGVPLACHVGAAVVVASSRDLLGRGVRLVVADARETRDRPGLPPAAAAAAVPATDPLGTTGSGTVFRLDPARITTPRETPVARHRMIEFLRALDCRRIEGAVSLNDGVLSLEVSTNLTDRGTKNAGHQPQSVDRAWLDSLPGDGVMAMISLAIDSRPKSWDRAFAVADRVERADPTRAGLAPLRTRMNLLAAGAGLNLEADLLPHLRGLSACLYGDPARPGRIAGALLVLHLDDPGAAERLARQAAARVGTLAGPKASGIPLVIETRDREIRIAWGDGVRASDREDRPAPGRSLAAVCGGWAAEGRQSPVRIGAVWPARLWRPAGVADSGSAVFRALADDPPVVWWGWSEPGREHDLLRWTNLRGRVRRLLDALGADSKTVEAVPPPPIPDSEFKIPDKKK